MSAPLETRDGTSTSADRKAVLLQTVVDVAAEKNSTLVMPFPVELLRFFDRATGDTSDISNAATTARGQGTVTNGAPPTVGSRLASVDVATAQLVPPQG
jgi:hypothetical protein